MRQPMRPAQIFLGAIAVVFVAAAVLFGGRAIRLDLPVVYRDAPRSALPPTFRSQMEVVLRTFPPGAALLHVSSVPESWYSRMWERALYPRNAVVSLQPPELDPASFRRARERFGIRFAISVGNSSPGNGYRWSVPMGTLPGLDEEAWFGELAP
jgi:hypothetical protein